MVMMMKSRSKLSTCTRISDPPTFVSAMDIFMVELIQTFAGQYQKYL